MIYRTHKSIQKMFLVFLVVLLSHEISAQNDSTIYQKYFYENGQISSEGLLVNGLPDGYWKTYFENGVLKTEGNRKNFIIDSLWIFYNEEGFKVNEITFVEGKKEGIEREFSKEGILEKEFTNVKGKKEGESLYFYATGEVSKRVFYENDKEENEGFEYEKDGRIITKLRFKNGFIRSIVKINRLNSAGQKKGTWEELYSNGKIKETGNWTKGKRNGLFKFYKRNGDLEKLVTYKNGEIIEDAAESIVLDIRKEFYNDGTIKIIGSYNDGEKQGTFREYDKQGNIINGYIYKNNEKTGEGIVDKEGKRQGDWKLYYKTGELKAEGKYVDGKKEGKWKYYFQTGQKKQIGEYRKGQPHGYWKWYFANGTMQREENYRKGKEDGMMIEYNEAGEEIYKGAYEDGYKIGPWFYHVNDYKELGSYMDDEKDGKWEAFYEDGTKYYVGEFSGGVALGKHVWYHPNGTKKLEGKYESGEKHGEWKEADELGVITNVLIYEYGIVRKVNGTKVKQKEEEINGEE